MRFQLTSKTGQVLLSNLPSDCLGCVSSCSESPSTTQKVTCPYDNKTRRKGVKKSKLGSVYLCSSSYDDIKSTKTFTKKFQSQMVLLGQIDLIRKAVIKDFISPTKRLTHNITSLNAHCLQEFYSLVPQDELSSGYKNQLSLVEKKIKGNARDASKAFLRILKNNRFMKTELSVFQKLYDSEAPVRKKPHEIKKVLLSAFHVFFQDFTDKSILVTVDNHSPTGYFDYESIIVAFMHLADNATKYASVNSEIKISFSENGSECIVSIKMLSIRIEESETDVIFQEGYSGINSKKLGISGTGIGMYIVEKLLKLNNSRIELNRNVSPGDNKTQLSVPYEMNEIKVFFPRYNNNKKNS